MLFQGLLLTNLVLVSTLALVGWRNRSTPSARTFALLEGVSALWVGLTLVGLELPESGGRLRVWGMTTGLSLVVVLLWFAFILRYTGRDRWLRSRRFGVVAGPLLAGAAVYWVAPRFRPLAGELDQSSTAAGTIVDSSIGMLGAVLGGYVYVLFFVGLYLVIKTVVEGPNNLVGQALAFLLGTVVTVIAGVGEVAGVPVAGYPLTQSALGVQALFWGYAVFGEQFLQARPGTARVGERAVFDELDDGILLVGNDGTVARVNPTARRYLGEDPVGSTVDTVLERMDASGFDDLPTQFEQRGRCYQAKVSAVTDWRGESVGQALVIRDVTGLIRRQQRLEVLNRIMRHNLRNDMTVIRGCANRIRGSVNGEVADMSSTIERKADGLLTISEKAVEIDRVLEHEPDPEPVDLERFLRRRVEPLADRYPDATLEMSVGPVGLRTVPRLLSLVVEEAVENALAHAGDAPLVSIEASTDGDGARIDVADDGDGIPELEVAAVTAGQETNLEHATSLGLWLIRWGTQALGGEAEFETSADGTTVRLRIPNLDPTSDGTSTGRVETGVGDRATGTARSTDG